MAREPQSCAGDWGQPGEERPTVGAQSVERRSKVCSMSRSRGSEALQPQPGSKIQVKLLESPSLIMCNQDQGCAAALGHKLNELHCCCWLLAAFGCFSAWQRRRRGASTRQREEGKKGQLRGAGTPVVLTPLRFCLRGETSTP